MEDILDLYAEPYQPAFPVICFDEVPYQMVSETKLPLPMRNGKPGRYDFEYRREVTCNLFMFLQPLAGWRYIKVTDHSSPTVYVTGAGVGVDSAWEQKKLKARKMLENAVESPASSACFVGWLFVLKYSTCC
jgi:hypothetical protein